MSETRLKVSHVYYNLACENIRFSSLFAAGDVPIDEESEEKRMFSQANYNLTIYVLHTNR